MPLRPGYFSAPQVSEDGTIKDGAKGTKGKAVSEEVAAYYTLEGIKSRYELMQHPKVAYALEQIWIAANTNAEDELIDYDEYEVMHRKIILALDPSTSDGDIKEALAEDWVQDSEGHPEGLDRSMRHISPRV